MASQLETTGTLERRLTLSVNPADISSKVQERLRSMAKTTRMPGFRPGKVPVRLIEQSYGPQVHSEVLGEAISRAFSDAVQAENLRVAGQPEIAPKDESQGPDATEFVATFEVYPDVKLGDPSTLEVDRYNASVDDKALEATIDVLRKQRTRWNAVDRAGEKGDRATIDFVGKLDGEAFPGGSAEGFPMVLGEGRMLPDFEAGVLGKKAGETVTFDVKFPDDYNAEHLAGKTAQFEVKIQKVEAPELPEVDADFARQMGQEDGDVEKFRADVRTNLEREVRQRVQSRTKSSVMDKIVGLADIELPKALVAQEAESLAARMREDLQARGVDLRKAPPVPTDAFTEQATRRVRLGLIVSEVVRENALQAKPEQIRKQIKNKLLPALKGEFAKLQNISVKTGSHKEGILWARKSVDDYTTLGKLYPNLIDKSGKLNVALAESILKTHEFRQGGKEALENMLALYKQNEEAIKTMNDYLHGLFGSLGNAITDSLVTAFRTGEDATRAFTSNIGDMLNNFAKQIAYSSFLAPLMEKAQKEVADAMRLTGVDNQMEAMLRAMSSLVDGVKTQIPAFNEYLKKTEEMVQAHGFDLAGKNSDTRSATAKGIAQASQDSIDVLTGLWHTNVLLSERTANATERMVAVLEAQGLRRLPSAQDMGLDQFGTAEGRVYAELQAINRNTKVTADATEASRFILAQMDSNGIKIKR